MSEGSVVFFLAVIVVGLYIWARSREVSVSEVSIAVPSIPAIIETAVVSDTKHRSPLYWME